MCISERCRHVRHNGARGGAFGAARDHVGMEWRRPAPGEGRSAKYDSEISQQTDKQKMYHGARTDDAGTDDLTEPKIPPEPFDRVEPEGFLYLCQPVADVRERALFQTGYLRL